MLYIIDNLFIGRILLAILIIVKNFKKTNYNKK